MKKGELIHLHILLAQFKKYCEQNDIVHEFPRYEAVGISYIRVGEKKEEHMRAIFALCLDILDGFGSIYKEEPKVLDPFGMDCSNPGELIKVIERLYGLCN